MFATISRQKFNPKFKEDAIQLANKIGVPSAASKLHLKYHTLYRWAKNQPVEQPKTPSYLRPTLPGFDSKNKDIIYHLRNLADLIEKSNILIS